jgi:SAM-dependent methyltransferase
MIAPWRWGTVLRRGAMLGCMVSASACGASTERVARSDGQSGVVVGQDTVAPAAVPGAPAEAFPSPMREVADIVAPRWTDEDARDDAGEFNTVAKLAGIRAGQAVADIGAGDGYYVARLSPLVGANGVVYGQDIMTDYLGLLQRRVRRDNLRNVRVVLGDPHDPRLPASSVDVALMIHMYHEITQPFALLWNLATAMRPGGTLVILDLERPTFGHGTPPSLLRCELERVGYTQRSITSTGPEEYVAVFVAPDSARRPAPAALKASLTAKPCRAP